MPIVTEATDAAANTTTNLEISPGDSLRGSLTRNDRDWIRIELIEGRTYEFIGSALNREIGYEVLPVVRDIDGDPLTSEGSEFRYTDFPARTVITVPVSGTYYIDTQYNWKPIETPGASLAFPGFTTYEIVSRDFGQIGLTETLDAPGNFNVSPYSLTVGETFSGSIDPDVGDDGYYLDFDALKLLLPTAGNYALSVSQTNADGVAAVTARVSYLHQPAFTHIQETTQNGATTLEFTVFGEAERILTLFGENASMGDAYEVTLSYVGPLDPDQRADMPYDPDRPIDPAPVIEVADLPEDASSIILSPGEILLGTINSFDSDWVGMELTAGVNYAFWFTGTGSNPLLSGSAFTTDFEMASFAQSNGIGRYDLHARVSGTLFLQLETFSFQSPVAENYSFTFAETRRLTEVIDAPSSSATPYRFEANAAFKGFLGQDDSDWIGVELVEGHTYVPDLSGISSNISADLLIRNGEGAIVAEPLGGI